MGDVDHPPFTGRATRFLSLLLVPLLAAVVAGAVVLWPDGSGPRRSDGGARVDATVETVRTGACADTDPEAGIDCTRIEARVRGGGIVALDEEPASVARSLRPGDPLVVARSGGGADVRYALAGRDRSTPLALLALAAATLLVAVARLRGARLLAALAVTGAVVVAFAVPAVLDGGDPTAVAVVAGAAIATALLLGAVGLGPRPATALVGALLGVGAAGLAAHLVVTAADLADLGSAAPSIELDGTTLALAGLVVAGTVIGAAGAVAQLALRVVDATWDLRDAAPGERWFGIARTGARRARESLTAAAGTLAVAWVGAALPVAVVLAAGDQPVVEGLATEAVAVEVGRVLAGVAGLALTVPLTAAVAAAVVVRESKRGPVDPRRFRSKKELDLWAQAVE